MAGQESADQSYAATRPDDTTLRAQKESVPRLIHAIRFVLRAQWANENARRSALVRLNELERRCG